MDAHRAAEWQWRFSRYFPDNHRGVRVLDASYLCRDVLPLADERPVFSEYEAVEAAVVVEYPDDGARYVFGGDVEVALEDGARKGNRGPFRQFSVVIPERPGFEVCRLSAAVDDRDAQSLRLVPVHRFRKRYLCVVVASSIFQQQDAESNVLSSAEVVGQVVEQSVYDPNIG